jgi:hypothetical protein
MRSLLAVLALVCTFAAPAALATTYYVDGTNGDDGWDGRCETWDGGSCGPKATIQAAIDIATHGDAIWVAPGRYYENVHYDGKNIALRAHNASVALADPLDPAEASIIDGSLPENPSLGSAVRFDGTELPTCALDGFTVTGGMGVQGTSGPEGGGIFGGDGGQVWVWTQATISNCTITANTARWGGGLWQCGGVIADCHIVDNATEDPGGSNHNGGGLGSCNGTIVGCIIAGNSSYGGAGLYSCIGEIVDCDISGNVASWSGGAMMWCDHSTVINCNLSDNIASTSGYGAGGAVFSQPATYVNCTFANNVALAGGAIYAWQTNAPTMSNCVLWGNVATTGEGDQIKLNAGTVPCTLVIEYSDIEGGEGGIFLANPDLCTVVWGDGMLEVDPLFADSVGADYHLTPDSPCIDAANNLAVPIDVMTDLDGRLRFADRPATPDTGNGTTPIVDMGPYEYQCDGDLDGDGDIDLTDLARLLANYGTAGTANYADGDLDGDGDVDLTDLAALLAVYGTACP